MVSAWRTVLSRCAIRRVVLDAMMLLRASCTTFSLSLSRALVASSRRRILGLRMMARAIAIRCFCPPESCAPLSPTSVSYLSGRSITKVCA
mmetsp:Transcript_11838/g.29664  ORF Transcript_11838/g.29664 Transcript_11838/m.29664 type:complete len:91 (-) Transcript_11838:374-646(-)